MSLDNVWYPYAVKLPTPEITHLTDISVNHNQQIITETQAGSAVPCFVGIGSINPEIPFSTRQLKSILDTISADTDGEGIVRNMTADQVDIWYRAGKPMSVREDITASKHLLGRITNASMMHWNTIRVVQDGFCEVDVSIITAKISAGSTVISWLGQQQAPTRTGCERTYGLGPVELNGVALKGVTAATFSSGVVPEPRSGDGIANNIYNGVRNYHVTCELQMDDLSEIYGSEGAGKIYGLG